MSWRSIGCIGWLLAVALCMPAPPSAAAGPQPVQSADAVKRLYDARDYSGCLALIQRGGTWDVTDPQIWYFRAGCRLALGDHAAARAEYSRVIGRWPDDAYSYLGRALAAAHQGCGERVKKDFAFAAALKPKETEAYRLATAKEIDGCLARVPKESPAELLAALKKADADGETTEQLAVRAERLALAAVASRFVKEEAFTDRLHELTAAAKADPKSAERLAELAEFLVSPFVMRTVTFDGRTGRTHIALTGADPTAADRYATAALQLDPNNLRALTQKVLTCQAANNPDQGMEWARRALQVDDNADCARFVLDYYSLVAGKLTGQANDLRSLKFRDERRTDGVYHTTIYPSEADKAQADFLDARADEYRRKAANPLTQLIKEAGETAEGFLLRAELAQWRGHYDEALADAEAAIKLDFFNQDAHDFIVELAPKIQRPEFAREHDTILQNFVNPWPGRALQDAWTLFPQQKWDECLKALDAAERLNPADPAIPAYRLAVAAQRNDSARVEAETRLTIFMEEGRARLAGKSVLQGTSPLQPDDVMLTLNARALAARYNSTHGNPAGADGRAQANAQLGRRVPRELWQVGVQRAAIPSTGPAAANQLPTVGALLGLGVRN